MTSLCRYHFKISVDVIVNTSAATICATEAAKKEGAGDDFDSETSKMINTKNEHKE